MIKKFILYAEVDEELAKNSSSNSDLIDAIYNELEWASERGITFYAIKEVTPVEKETFKH